MIVLAAILYALLAGGAIVFQLALAAGLPWGAYAMGGKFPGRFPPLLRVTAVLQALLLGFLAAVVLSRAGLALPQWSQASERLVWIVVALALISVVLNSITPSVGERRIWMPVAWVVLVSSLIVALASP